MTTSQFRSAEVLLAKRSAARLASGRGQLVLLTGEEGLGKTAIAKQVVEQADRDVACLWADIGASGEPRSAWNAVLREQRPMALESLDHVGAASADRTLAEDVAGVLGWLVRKGPTILVLEDVHCAATESLEVVESLLPIVDSAPLLLLLTADSAAGQPEAVELVESWGRLPHSVHLPLSPLPDAALSRLFADWSWWIPNDDDRREIVTAAQGNPRLAQEMALWMSQRRHLQNRLDAGRPTGHSLLGKRIRAAEQGEVLTTLALSRPPMTEGFLARVLGLAMPFVAEVLDNAIRLGVVRVVSEHPRTYAMSHPIFAQAVQASSEPAIRVRAHGRLSRAFAAEVDTRSDALTEVVWHSIHAGDRGPDVARMCLKAAQQAEGSDLLSATRIAHWGLQADVSPSLNLEFLRILGRCAARQCDRSEMLWAYSRALDIAATLQNANLTVELTSEVLERDPRWLVDIDGGVDTARRALAACGSTNAAVAARLQALLAGARYRKDPAGARAAVDAAVETARRSGSATALGFTLRVASRLSSGPSRLPKLAQFGSELRSLGRPTAGAALVSLAAVEFARGNRDAVEVLHDEYAEIQARTPDSSVKSGLGLLRLALAFLDCDDAALLAGLRESRCADSELTRLGPSLGLAWKAFTGRTLHIDVLQPDPENCRPDESGLRVAGASLVRAERGDEGERERLGGLFNGLRNESTVADDDLWPARVILMARGGALNADRRLCASAIRALSPFPDQFLLVGRIVPVGPAGWFVASCLKVLGSIGEALDANREAELVCRRARSAHWVARCLIQRTHLLKRTDPESAARSLEDARRLIHGLPHVSLEGEWLKAERALEPSVPDSGPGAALVAGALPVVPGPREPRLTARQREILRLAAHGFTNAEIAKELNLSIPTIERHCSNAYRRLGVRNRARALMALLGKEE